MADIKFSELPKATTSKDSDEIAILQDGVNKMIASPVLESKIINKTVSRVIEQGGASLNVINLKGVVPTYADLALITPTPELNDAYQVEADGLVYVYNDNGFQSDGDGFNLLPDPEGVVEEGNTEAVSGGEVYDALKIHTENIDIFPYIEKIEGYYVDNTTGVVGIVVGYSVTEFIDISDFDILKFPTNVYQNFAYYSEKSPSSYICGSTFNTTFSKKPSGAKYVRFTIKDGDSWFLQLFKNDSISVVKNKLSEKFSLSGYYINATNGKKQVLSSYSYSDFIPVKLGDVVRYKINDLTNNGTKHLTFFNNKRQYISGNTTSYENTAPQDGYVVLSLETNLINRSELTINEVIVDFSKSNAIITDRFSVKGINNPYHCYVLKTGGDFNTFADAINFGKNIGRADRKFIIYFDGEFNEHVNIAPYHINIIGLNKESSIITTSSGDYYNNPLNVSGRNSGSNFKAIAKYDGLTTPTIWGYGMHCDSIGGGKSVWFNCDFISEVNSGVGLGTQNNQQYLFLNCRIENSSTNYGSGLYLHNSPYANHHNMSVWVENCVISSKLTKSITIDDSNANAGHNDDDGTTMTFINNNCWSEINGKNDNSISFTNAPTTGDIGQIKIGLRSFGNNVNKINK